MENGFFLCFNMNDIAILFAHPGQVHFMFNVKHPLNNYEIPYSKIALCIFKLHTDYSQVNDEFKNNENKRTHPDHSHPLLQFIFSSSYFAYRGT